MKKALLQFIFVLTGSALTAQSIQLALETDTATIINGTEITVSGDNSQYDVVVDIRATNMGATKSIKTKKIEMFYGVGVSRNAICWSVCTAPVEYGTNPVVTTDAISLSNGAYGIFNGHLYPQSVTGATKLRYVWYDENNTNDSAYVDVIFNISSAASITEEQLSTLKVYPNPATQQLNLEFQSGNSDATLVMRNLLGEVVYTDVVNQFYKKTIDVSAFKRGAYMVSILSENKVLTTKKVILTK